MKTLLDFILHNVEVLYLNPTYRFTNSKQRALCETDASISLTGDALRWTITNDRGQIYFTVVPLESVKNWFWLSLIRQYLQGGDEIQVVAPLDDANWHQIISTASSNCFQRMSHISRVYVMNSLLYVMRMRASPDPERAE